MKNIILLCALLFSGVASAGLITVNASGIVNQDYAGFGLSQGDAISLSFSYSDTDSLGAIIWESFDFNIGSFSGSANTGIFYSDNSLYNPYFNPAASNGAVTDANPFGAFVDVFGIAIFPGVSGAIGTGVVPLTVPDILQATTARFDIRLRSSVSDVFVQSTLTDISIGQSINVPEPSTLAIFALGIMGLAARRFKKQ